jgi:hypothetical protein
MIEMILWGIICGGLGSLILTILIYGRPEDYKQRKN